VQPEIDSNKYLSSLISNPDLVSAEDFPLLKDSVQKYPYFSALHLLLAKASIGSPAEPQILATTALYTNGKLLHQFISVTEKASEPSEIPLAVGPIEDEEIFEEIGELDYHKFTDLPTESTAPLTDEVKVKAAPQIETLEDEFVLENIAATDFFAFQENFSSDQVKVAEPSISTSEVTNYDDDTLPYTFLWWLAKTRKEHQSIFQPYVSRKSGNQNELQQQYVEHIFHIQSPFNAEEILNSLPEVKGDPKDLAIIDQFIKNAPHITAPRPEQIDNENKAKKSAEDHNDLVSETLAKIYIEQMLYHKAIETYEKLILKFPEKSRYFADLIQSIEKKI
jgi:hypothetical protein